LSPEPAPPQFSSESNPEFAPLAPGASLAGDDDDAPRAVDENEAASLLRPVDDDGTAAALLRPVPDSGDVVAGEHRVAIQTRGGRTRRGTVTNVDLGAPQFPLLPQGGQAAEVVPHSDVKVIFFMLAANEAAPAPSGRKVRVTFSDGRMIEGHRDGADLRQGFFLIPLDAQKTNTKRIYVAKDAVASIANL
jgi:small nuclear ribonucleoprotein (snRNP)-like protein